MAVNTRRARWRDARGAELIEFALVLPIFLLLTAAIFDFGMMFRTYEAVTNAAREGARVGVLPTYEAADVQARVDAYMATAGLSGPTPSPSPTDRWQHRPGRLPHARSSSTTRTNSRSWAVSARFSAAPSPPFP